MKDYKAEFDKLKGEIAELRKQLQYERDNRERRENRADEMRNTLKQLILDVLND